MRVQQEVAISGPKPIAAIVPEHAAFTGRTAFTGIGEAGSVRCGGIDACRLRSLV